MHSCAAIKDAGIVDRRRALLFITLIIALSVLAYANALCNGFVYDDVFQVVENHWLRDLGYLPEVFRKGVWGFWSEKQSNYYRPLMHVSYMLTYAVFGLRPWAFHLVNILVHAGVSVMVYLTGAKLCESSRLRISPLVPLLAALLFATHPIHTEVVTWIAGIPELFVTLFYLLSFYFYMKAVADDDKLYKGVFFLSLLCFFLATLSKEPALTLPAVLVVFDYCFRKRPFRLLPCAIRYAPYVVVAAVYFVIRTNVLGGFASQKRHTDLNAYEYFINVFPLVSEYFGKLVFPSNLNIFHVFHPIHSVLEPKGVISLVVVGVFLLLLYFSHQKNRLVFFCAVFIVIPLLPVLYIPVLGENTFTERYLYLPSFGFVLIVAWGIEWLREKKPRMATVLNVAVVLVLGASMAATLHRNRIWKDDLTLWLDTVKKSPDSVTPHSELGIAYATAGEPEKALEQYRIALTLNPNFADCYTNIGMVYRDMGRPDKAMEYFAQALRLKPSSSEAHNNIGLAYAEMGMFDKAIEHYRESLRLKPLAAGVHNNLGSAYESLGLVDDAIAEFKESLRIKPDYTDAYINLGVAYAKSGRIDEALEQFSFAAKLDPNNAAIHHNLANVYRMKGMPEEAEVHRRRAMSLGNQ